MDNTQNYFDDFNRGENHGRDERINESDDSLLIFNGVEYRDTDALLMALSSSSLSYFDSGISPSDMETYWRVFDTMNEQGITKQVPVNKRKVVLKEMIHLAKVGYDMVSRFLQITKKIYTPLLNLFAVRAGRLDRMAACRVTKVGDVIYEDDINDNYAEMKTVFSDRTPVGFETLSLEWAKVEASVQKVSNSAAMMATSLADGIENFDVERIQKDMLTFIQLSDNQNKNVKLHRTGLIDTGYVNVAKLKMTSNVKVATDEFVRMFPGNYLYESSDKFTDVDLSNVIYSFNNEPCSSSRLLKFAEPGKVGDFYTNSAAYTKLGRKTEGHDINFVKAKQDDYSDLKLGNVDKMASVMTRNEMVGLSKGVFLIPCQLSRLSQVKDLNEKTDMVRLVSLDLLNGAANAEDNVFLKYIFVQIDCLSQLCLALPVSMLDHFGRRLYDQVVVRKMAGEFEGNLIITSTSVYPVMKACSKLSILSAPFIIAAMKRPKRRSFVIDKWRLAVRAFETSQKLKSLKFVVDSLLSKSYEYFEIIAGPKSVKDPVFIQFLEERGIMVSDWVDEGQGIDEIRHDVEIIEFDDMFSPNIENSASQGKFSAEAMKQRKAARQQDGLNKKKPKDRDEKTRERVSHSSTEYETESSVSEVGGRGGDYDHETGFTGVVKSVSPRNGTNYETVGGTVHLNGIPDDDEELFDFSEFEGLENI